MNKKSFAVFFVALAVALMPVLTNVYAHGSREGKECEQGHGLDSMFYGKAHMILENQEKLGITQDKIDEIKKLKLDTKKMLIKQDAEIEIASLDLKALLHAYPVDVEAANKLVDQKFDLKKTEAKGLVEALAKLKGALTKEQYDKLREIWKAQEKKEHSDETK